MSERNQQEAALRVRKLYRVFGPFLRPYRGQITFAYLALGATVGMALLRPWPLKLILDSIILRKRPLPTFGLLPADINNWDPTLLLTILCGSLVLIVVLESAFGYGQKLLFASVGQSTTTDVLEHVYTHLQTLPRGEMKDTRRGDVIVRLTSDIKRLRDLLVEHVQKLGNYGLTFLSTLAVMAALNWKLTLLGLAVVPLIYWTSRHFSREIRSASRQKRKKEGEVASVVQESLTGMAVVQAFAQEDAERERFRQQTRESLDAAIESSRVGGAFTRSVQVLNTVGMALVIWFGARSVLDGSLTPGDLVVFSTYIVELYRPVQTLSELSAQFMEAVISGERVLDLLEVRPHTRDLPHAIKAPPFRGQISFDHVSFGYHPDSRVLDDISFRVEPGERVALVGASGSGKSTILNLLLRFLDPQQGRVTIDGCDIRDFTLRSLRRQFCVVLQDPVLFHRTVRENIAFGAPRATMSEIIQAATYARAHEFIEALPDGYETVLHEHGTNLSGGQRQRIALARAFLRNQPILLLDEPTTGLDAVTEAQLTETFDELARGRTTIVIAHKLSTIESADRIVVLDGGRVAEAGSHSELLESSGRYRQLYEAQAAETTPPESGR